MAVRVLRRTAVARSSGVPLPQSLQTTMTERITYERARVKALLTAKGDEVVSKATLRQVYEGSRGITTMNYEPSLLDAQTGITFRGLSIPECQKRLTKAKGGDQPLPEAMLWLLLTGNTPSDAETAALIANLNERAAALTPAINEAFAVLDAMPHRATPGSDSEGFTHPMNALIAAYTVLSRHSKFAAAYKENTVKKPMYWSPVLEDTLDLVATLPAVGAKIFRNTFKASAVAKERLGGAIQLPGQDFTTNLVQMMGIKNDVVAAGGTIEDLIECLRLYLTIHVDHEGGNVSAHTTVLVGSALSDPYLSYAAGMAGLAGPLHGLANQEVLSFLKGMMKWLGEHGVDINTISYEDLKAKSVEYAWSVLNSGKVIPGFGHAVLRQTDPRYMVQREFALTHMKDFPLFRVVSACFETFPQVLTEHGKTKNPFPNVDAHSGCLLQRYGLVQEDYYTVLFGLSRGFGVLSALTWNRALGQPIERPKSVTTDEMCAKFNITV